MRLWNAGPASSRASFSVLLGGIIVLSMATSCTDVGDNSAPVPGLDSGTASDGTLADGQPESDGAGLADDGGAQDSSAQDSGAQDSEPEDSGAQEEAGGNAPETGAAEGGADSGQDATIADSGGPDAGAPDTGGPDAGGNDATADSAASEAGADATAGGLVPCTSAGQTACVGCYGSAGNVCTATEAIFVARDIAQGLVTTAGVETDDMTSCYSCLVDNNCLDFPADFITGTECDDLSGNFANGSGASVPAAATCLAVLSCITGAAGQNCAGSANGLSSCYCGPGGGPSAQCQGANASKVNGPCIDQEVAGFAYTRTDASDILAHYGSSTQPSGLANDVFACATSNRCASCL